MTGKQRLAIGLVCGVAILGGAAWADTNATRFGGATVSAVAQEERGIDALLRATRLESLVHVVATEGARHGLGLEASLFPGRGGVAWGRVVSSIQAPERLVPVLTETIRGELGADELAAASIFFASALGRKVAAREVEARRAMLDADVEAEAMAAVALPDPTDDRAALVDEVIETLDLVGANVSGGLNANYAFYRGLGDGGALARRLTEREMLAMVWGQEPEVRASMTRWLTAYLSRAYAPLSDQELRDYIAFLGTKAGRRWSAALFAGFGRVFEETSYELGLAAARFIAMEDA